jgi:hypothetical protein
MDLDAKKIIQSAKILDCKIIPELSKQFFGGCIRGTNDDDIININEHVNLNVGHVENK